MLKNKGFITALIIGFLSSAASATESAQTNPHPPLLPHANATAPLTHPIQSAPQKMAELKPPVFLPAPPSDPVSTSPTTVSSPPHETPPPKPEVKIATSPTVPTPPPLPAKIAEAPALLATIPLPKEPVAAPDGNKALTMEVQVLEQENQALRKKLGLGETDPLKDIKVDAVSQIHEDVLRGRIAELEKEISRMGMKNNKEDLPEKTKNPLPSSLKN